MIAFARILTIIPFIFYAPSVFADTKARLLEVHDGDTITALYKSGKKYRIRLYGIDAPELSQPYGHASKNHLTLLLAGKNITIRSEGGDTYGRKLATIFVNEKNINFQMVKDGYAWHYKRYYKSEKMEKAQEYAKKNTLGLWKQKNPKEPWAYRREAKGYENANNKPLIKSPIKGVVICFDPERYKISIGTENCHKGSITVVK